MLVLLKQNVSALGRKGDVKNVKDGYFQNYLFPKGLAEKATPKKIEEAERLRKQQTIQKEQVVLHAQEILQKFKGLKIVMKAKAGGDKLYGSITEKDIIDALEQKIAVRLEPANLKLSEHIKVVGTYEVPVRLGDGIEGKFVLQVKAEK